MGRFGRIMALVATCAVFAAGMALMFLFAGIGYGAVLLLLVWAALYCWMLFAFAHYRQCRQEEFLLVLTAAAEADAPLVPALGAYLHDRPRGGLREAIVAILLFFVVPFYYWLWYRTFNYDRKVERVAELLQDGWSLHDALEMVPGVASRETILAVALGQDTGRLAECLRSLRSPARRRLATVWLGLMPRFAYPLFLLFVINGILTFLMIYIAPRLERIYREFNMAFPETTQQALALGHFAVNYAWAVALAVPFVVAVAVLLLVSPSFRWYFPVVRGIYRRYVSSQALQALAFLLQAGEPAPEALGVLAECPGFVGGARRRLADVRRRVERGEPLAESLHQGGLMPRAMVPLLKSAERVGNLPWALAELGDVLAQRLARRVQRLGLLLSPLPVVGVGMVVGVIVIGFFMPLIKLIDGLAR
jgi:type II secretory pathway component PulF